MHAKFLRKRENLEVAYKRSRLLYSSSSRAMSDLLSTFYVKYDQISVALGVVLMTLVCVHCEDNSNDKEKTFNLLPFQTCIVIVRFVISNNFSQTLTVDSKILTLALIAILSVVLRHFICEFTDCSLCLDLWFTHIIFLAMAFVVFSVFSIGKLTFGWSITLSTLFNSKFIQCLIFATGFHTLSLASSSFVEEEHQTWYFITHTFLLAICVMSLKKRQNDQWLLNAELLKTENRSNRTNVRSLFEKFFVELVWFALLGFLLIGRRLNQTGDKWLSLPDIGDYLASEENRQWNSCFVAVCE